MSARRFDLFRGIKERLFAGYRKSLEKNLRPLGLVSAVKSRTETNGGPISTQGALPPSSDSGRPRFPP